MRSYCFLKSESSKVIHIGPMPPEILPRYSSCHGHLGGGPVQTQHDAGMVLPSWLEKVLELRR